MSMGTTRTKRDGRLSTKSAQKRNSGGSPKKPSNIPVGGSGNLVFRKTIPVGDRTFAHDQKRHPLSRLHIGDTTMGRTRVSMPGEGFTDFKYGPRKDGWFEDIKTPSPSLGSVRNRVTDTVPMPDAKGTYHPAPRAVGRVDVHNWEEWERGKAGLKDGEYMLLDRRGRKAPVGGTAEEDDQPVGGRGGKRAAEEDGQRKKGDLNVSRASATIGKNAYDEYEARVARAQRLMGMGREAKLTDINPETGQRYSADEIRSEKRAGLEHKTKHGTIVDRRKAARQLLEMDMRDPDDNVRVAAERDYIEHLRKFGTKTEREDTPMALARFHKRMVQRDAMRMQAQERAQEAAEAAVVKGKGPTVVSEGGRDFYFTGKQYKPLGSTTAGKVSAADKGAALKDFATYYNIEDDELNAFERAALVDAISTPDAEGNYRSYEEIADMLEIPRRGELNLQDSRQNLALSEYIYQDLKDNPPKWFGKGNYQTKLKEARDRVNEDRAEVEKWEKAFHTDMSGANFFNVSSPSGGQGLSRDDLDSNEDGKVDEKDEMIEAAMDIQANPDGWSEKERMFADAVMKAYKAELDTEVQGRMGQ